MSRPATCRADAFSLLEVIIVLVLLSIIVGLVAPTVGRSAGAGADRRALGELVNTLMASRLDAIRSGADASVEMIPSGRGLTLRTGDQERLWKGWPLIILGDTNEPVDSIRITFGARGRADVDRLTLQSARSPTRLWRIEFDPVGGVPTAHRLKEASS